MNGETVSRKFLWLGLFAVAMGFLEAIVVVYLREMYYPSGFGFPLGEIPPRILGTEMLREACTLVMLCALAVLSARETFLRLSFLLYIFGMWDVFYYVALKLLLGWPPSLFTWDVLFLIPVTWLAPVLAPLVSAFTMVLMSLLIARLHLRYGKVRAGAPAWTLFLLGSAAILFTFTEDYARIIIEGGFAGDLPALAGNPAFMEAVSTFVPSDFGWPVFAIGEGMILLGLAVMYRDTRRSSGIPLNIQSLPHIYTPPH